MVEKYLVTHSVYFRLTSTVESVVGITNGKILYCHGISEGSVEKKNPMREYINRTVYD